MCKTNTLKYFFAYFDKKADLRGYTVIVSTKFCIGKPS